jgi:hypothetical protein
VAGGTGPQGPGGPQGPAGPNLLIAAGHIGADAVPFFRFGGLDVGIADQNNQLLYVLRFPTFARERAYVVKGTPIRGDDERVRIFEVVLSPEVIEAAGSDPAGGLHVRLVATNGVAMRSEFMVEISDFTDVV